MAESRRVRVRVAVSIIAIGVLLAACTSAAGVTGAGTGADTVGPAATTSAPVPTPRATPLRVVRWGVNDEMLSVLVENMTAVEIRSAHVVITARDAHGVIIASVSGPPGALCCTIIGLRPHATFGLFADFGPGVVRTAHVSVDYSQVSVAARIGGGRPISASHLRLRRSDGQTLVDAYLGSAVSLGPYVAVQAVLTDHNGTKLVAVISGRFYCLFPGHRLNITMQLFHPVPPGTVVQRVTAFVIPKDLADVTSALPACVAQ
jgi:hypothetical protein